MRNFRLSNYSSGRGMPLSVILALVSVVSTLVAGGAFALSHYSEVKAQAEFPGRMYQHMEQLKETSAVSVLGDGKDTIRARIRAEQRLAISNYIWRLGKEDGDATWHFVAKAHKDLAAGRTHQYTRMADDCSDKVDPLRAELARLEALTAEEQQAYKQTALDHFESLHSEAGKGNYPSGRVLHGDFYLPQSKHHLERIREINSIIGGRASSASWKAPELARDSHCSACGGRGH